MNFEKLEFFIQVVEFGVIASPVITLILQKLKKTIKMKADRFRVVSAILSIILGYEAAILFSDFDVPYAIVCGVIICAGADAVYKVLYEGKKPSEVIVELMKRPLKAED